MAKRFALSTVFLVLTLTASCGEAPRDQPPGDAESKTYDHGPVAEHMGRHFEAVTAVQKALIRGDLDAIAEPTDWLESHPAIEGLPDGWMPYVEDMRTMARLSGEAKTPKAASGATAGMVLTCGECHAATEAEPHMPELGTKGLPPADQIDTVPHMLRHQWAMEQMWIGLINPSEESWKKGVEVLSDAPLQPQKMTEEAGLSVDIGALAQAVHEAGDEARQAKDWGARAQIYGGLLSTCADCHLKLGLVIDLR
jgi:cytochrome c553